MVEGVRDLDPEKGTKERKERLEKKRGMKLDDHPQYKAEEFQASTIRKEWASAYKGIYEKKLDPVGQEDADIDNDGDVDSSDKYLHKRRKAIGKAMGKKDVKEGTMDIKGFEIPQKERDAAKERLKQKTAEKQASLKKEEYVDEAITSEKGKAKAAEMIAKRTTASGRAKSGKGADVATIKHIGRSEREGLGGTPMTPTMARNPAKSRTSSGTGNKAARRAGLTPTREKPNAWKEEVQIDEVSSHLALTASQKADEERRKAAVAGDTSRAAAKAAQASRLYKGVGPRKD